MVHLRHLHGGNHVSSGVVILGRRRPFVLWPEIFVGLLRGRSGGGGGRRGGDGAVGVALLHERAAHLGDHGPGTIVNLLFD